MIEGLRACGCLSAEVIAQLERTGSDPIPPPRMCWLEPCRLLAEPPAVECSTPGGCQTVLEQGLARTGITGWLRFRDHVSRLHHWMIHGPEAIEPGTVSLGAV